MQIWVSWFKRSGLLLHVKTCEVLKTNVLKECLLIDKAVKFISSFPFLTSE